ncbi:MAG TPA: SDR family oxidoreductase, partial [Solirubrobacteraceae bacterium]|nr:SDR family oxidoreductase [Solirubrobacteraceae bacterium]
AIAGGHGKVALRLTRLLAGRGDRVVSLIRDPDHVGDVEDAGGEAVLCDLEVEEARGVAKHVAGVDAVVFAAGAGPGSGPERKRTVDLGAALKLIGAAERAGVRRYVMVSSIGAHDPEGRSEAMRPYLRAKAEADAALVASGLDYTIVRPGSLTDEPGTGRVALSTELGNRGPIARDDVAAVLAACLDVPETIGLTFEAFEGEQEVELAVRALARGAA